MCTDSGRTRSPVRPTEFIAEIVKTSRPHPSYLYSRTSPVVEVRNWHHVHTRSTKSLWHCRWWVQVRLCTTGRSGLSVYMCHLSPSDRTGRSEGVVTGTGRTRPGPTGRSLPVARCRSHSHPGSEVSCAEVAGEVR